MDAEAQWNAVKNSRTNVFGHAGMGILRVALLFGSAAIAMALIIAPIADNQTRARFSGVDRMSTGSIGQPNGYTVRRSVLQSSPTAICIIRGDGRRSGDCG